MSFTDEVESRFLQVWENVIGQQYTEIDNVESENAEIIKSFINDALFSNIPQNQLRRYIDTKWDNLFPDVKRPGKEWRAWDENELTYVIELCREKLGGKEKLWEKYLLIDPEGGAYTYRDKGSILEIALRLGYKDGNYLYKLTDSVDGNGINFRKSEELIFLFVVNHYPDLIGQDKVDKYERIIKDYKVRLKSVSAEEVEISYGLPMSVGFTQFAAKRDFGALKSSDELIDTLISDRKQMHGYSITNVARQLRLLQYLTAILNSKKTILLEKNSDGTSYFSEKFSNILSDISKNYGASEPIPMDKWGYPANNGRLVAKLMLGLDIEDIKKGFKNPEDINRFYYSIASVMEDIARSINYKVKIVTEGYKSKEISDVDRFIHDNIKYPEARRNEVVFIIMLLFMLVDDDTRELTLPDSSAAIAEGSSLKEIYDCGIISELDKELKEAFTKVTALKHKKSLGSVSGKDLLLSYMDAFEPVICSFVGFREMYIPNSMDSFCLQCLMSDFPTDIYFEAMYPYKENSNPDQLDQKRTRSSFGEEKYVYSFDLKQNQISDACRYRSLNEQDKEAAFCCVQIQTAELAKEDLNLLLCMEKAGIDIHDCSIKMSELMSLDRKNFLYNYVIALRMGFSIISDRHHQWMLRLPELVFGCSNGKNLLYGIRRRFCSKLFRGMSRIDADLILKEFTDVKEITYESFEKMFPKDEPEHYWAFFVLMTKGINVMDTENASKQILRIESIFRIQSYDIPKYDKEHLVTERNRFMEDSGQNLKRLMVNNKDDECHLKGTFEAALRYDLNRGTAFSAYAQVWINKLFLREKMEHNYNSSMDFEKYYEKKSFYQYSVRARGTVLYSGEYYRDMGFDISPSDMEILAMIAAVDSDEHDLIDKIAEELKCSKRWAYYVLSRALSHAEDAFEKYKENQYQLGS